MRTSRTSVQVLILALENEGTRTRVLLGARAQKNGNGSGCASLNAADSIRECKEEQVSTGNVKYM